MLDWQADILPVLSAGYELMNRSADGSVDGEDIALHLGREPDDGHVHSVIRQLDSSGYLNVLVWPGGMGMPCMIEPTEKGLQVTFGWPGKGADNVELLLRMLDERIADPEATEDERTRLQRLRTAAGDVGQGVLQSVLAAWLSHVSGSSGP